ncbi:hypothetical protein AAF712_006447 [Marasmius tenuissimus]|uniref:Uncharacterized protein n=1 Tax=Marasmius tenuissimus TaxID=585030 RepID=A0ABR2ZXK0_9AGAR
MSAVIPQSESHLGRFADKVSSDKSIQSEGNSARSASGDPDRLSKRDVKGREDTTVVERGPEVNLVDDCIEVAVDPPVVEVVKSEASGELVPPLGHVYSYYSDPESDQELDIDGAQENDPVALANRIRSLVETLALRSRPIPNANAPSTPHIPERILRDSLTGQPVPFPDAAFLSDTELIAQLKNMMVMNGVTLPPEDKINGWRLKTAGDKKSVWAVLDSFKAPPAHQWCADLPEYLVETGGKDGLNTSPSHAGIISDDSSIMMYFPLIPDESSIVELAMSSIASMPPLGLEGPKLKRALRKYRMYGTFGKRVDDENSEISRSWKFWKKRFTNSSTLLERPPASRSSRSLSSHVEDPKSDMKQRIWMPSPTKVSVQALWWGYRLFLPPPVLAILSDEQVETTKRVALITSSLTWFFTNIPVAALPLPMQPALLMLQKLVPYLGYIGSLITWSWDAVKSFDTGHGIILSATWLLPVALIPGTWEDYDFPAQSEDPVQSKLGEIGQDPKLEFALRLPLPPSSTSLLSTSGASSRSALSTLPSLNSNVSVNATPRLPSVPSVPTFPSTSVSEAAPVSAVSLMADVCHSNSQVSFTLPVIPSSVIDVAPRHGSETSSHSNMSSIDRSSTVSSVSGISSSAQSSVDDIEILPSFADRSPPPTAMSASPSSPLLLMSPTTVHDASLAAEILQMLDASNEELQLQTASMLDNADNRQREKSDEAEEEDEEEEEITTDGKGKREEIETAEHDVEVLVEHSPAADLGASGVMPSANVDTEMEGTDTSDQEPFEDAKAELVPVEATVAEAQAIEDPQETGTSAEIVCQTQVKKVVLQGSVSNLKQEKENLSPSPSSATPMVKTSSKSALARSTSANIRDLDGGEMPLNRADAKADSKAQGVSRPEKKEKKKSRTIAVVGGLWRFLTGSG